MNALTTTGSIPRRGLSRISASTAAGVSGSVWYARREVAASKPSATATILLKMLIRRSRMVPRIAGEVGLHVVLVRHHHRPIRQLLLPAHLEQRQHAKPRMRRDHAPLLVGEAIRSC